MDIKTLFSKNKALGALLCAALLGILLMAMSPSSSQEKAKSFTDCEKYSRQVEKKIASSLEDMCGGKISVIVSVDMCEQYVYAENRNESAEKTDSSDKTTVSGQYAAFNGEPLITTVIQPKIRGIAVICTGGDDPLLQNKIINLLSCAYSISSAKICVSGA